jgi:hypothetical protein
MGAENVVRGLEIFDRPWWFYRAHGALPSVDFQFRAPGRVTDVDIALCSRLIDAYSLAIKDAPEQSGMWSHEIFRNRQRDLVAALVHRDAQTLAQQLAAMFRSDAVQGMATGSVGASTVARLGSRVSRLNTLSKLVALAESQGAAPAECPEQGAVGLAFGDGLEALIARIEAALEVPLDFPDVGAAYGIRMAGRLIAPDTPDQLYAAARLRHAIEDHCADRETSLTVVEIGGGYGGMAYWLVRMIDARYVIVDLPVVNVLQGYFLAKALGEREVSFCGEPPGRLSILPTQALGDVQLPFDVLANKDSMPEIPKAALIDYLAWARDGCTGIFYSYNQEARAPYAGVPQNVVPKVLAEVGGFDLVRRDTSWLRRGYVEEIYRPRARTTMRR